MTAWRLIHYFDVWGNAKEGYEVNNLCIQGELHFQGDDWPTAGLFMKELKRVGFFRKTVRLRSVRFLYCYSERVEIEDRHGMPVCALELLSPETMDKDGPWHMEGSFPQGPRRVEG